MSNRISITVDLTKIDKNKIVPRSYQTEEGETVTLKEYKMDIVPLNKPQMVREGEGWELYKTHFISEPTTAEERKAEKPTIFLGSGFMFKDTSGSAEDDGWPI